MDMQKLIFAEIFPTKLQILLRLDEQHPTLLEFSEYDSRVVEFVHHGEGNLYFFDLSRTERKWVHLRSELFGIAHESYETDEGRILVISKWPGWSYNADVDVEYFEWGRASWQRGKTFLCATCHNVMHVPYNSLDGGFCYRCLEEDQGESSLEEDDDEIE